jgi:hypothetical protein
MVAQVDQEQVAALAAAVEWVVVLAAAADGVLVVEVALQAMAAVAPEKLLI